MIGLGVDSASYQYRRELKWGKKAGTEASGCLAAVDFPCTVPYPALYCNLSD